MSGSEDVAIIGVSSLENAEAGSLCYFSDQKFKSTALVTDASVVIVNASDSKYVNTKASKIVTNNPQAYFSRFLTRFYYPDESECLVSEVSSVANNANIHVSVALGENSTLSSGVTIERGSIIHPNVFIGKGASIGENCVIYPGVVILENSQLGNDCVVHPGAIIGGDGFGYAREDDRWLRIPQIGRVVIGNNVEIGCNSTIDRGALDDTVISDGVKIDNQVQIGHNCIIGDNTIIAGCVGIAGSVILGRNCRIGGAAMLTGHLTICDGVDISAGSLVSTDIDRAGRYTSVYPLSKHRDWQRNASVTRNLHSLNKKIKHLEKLLLKKQTDRESDCDERRPDKT